MINRVVLNETSYFGRGARKELKKELRNREYNKILVVSDESLEEAGVTRLVTDVLDDAGIIYFKYLHIKPNPTVKNVQEGLIFARTNRIDAIVAVGGGSVIDTAKAISIIMTNTEHENVTSLQGVVETRNKGLPLFALPTTSGTAAEACRSEIVSRLL